ncbi:MAG: hypothetical protein IT304_12400 [Dehalococcoidia bacterium]|nr:hypothetical protein [Dehalococcoidia bacterium]
MSHPLLRDARFYLHLALIDADAAEQARKAGCPDADCGGVLHLARFDRKPRAVAGFSWRTLGEEYAKRWSFCCAEEGCRRRVTPVSVRFLGRRWYLGVVVLLANALTHGLDYGRGKGLSRELGVPWRTLERWRRWWQETLPATALWRGAGLVPPLVPEAMPGALLARFAGDESARVLGALRWLAPITTTSPGRSI